MSNDKSSNPKWDNDDEASYAALMKTAPKTVIKAKPTNPAWDHDDDTSYAAMMKAASLTPTQQIKMRDSGYSPSHPIKSYIKDQMRGATEGLASLPVDVPAMGMAGGRYLSNLAGEGLHAAKSGIQHMLGNDNVKPYRPYVASDTEKRIDSAQQKYHQGVNHLMDKAGIGYKNIPVPVDEYGKESGLAKYGGRIAAFGLGNLIPGSMAVKNAKRMLPAAVVEGLTTVDSAMLSQETKEYAENEKMNPQVAEALGAIVGGSPFIPGHIAYGAAGAGERARRALNPEHVGSDASRLASEQVVSSLNATPKSLSEISRTSGLERLFPGMSLTLGQRSGARGVLDIEKKIASSSPEDIARYDSAMTGNKNALNSAFELAYPKPSGEISSIASKEYRAKIGNLNNLVTKNNNDIQALAKQFSSNPMSEIGARIREKFSENMEATRGIKTEKYNDVYSIADKHNIKTDMNPYVKIVRDIEGKLSNTHQGNLMPPVFSEILSKYGGARIPSAALTKTGNKVLDMKTRLDNATAIRSAATKNIEAEQKAADTPFREFHSLYKRVNRELRLAKDDTTIHYLTQLKDGMTEQIRKLEGEKTGNLGEHFHEANRFYADDYVGVYKKGLGGRIGADGKFGEITSDEKIVDSLILKNNAKTSIDEFYQIFKNDAEATQLLKNGFYDKAYRKFISDKSFGANEISPKAIESFIKNHKEAIDQIPGLKEEMMNADRLNDRLLARRQTLTQRAKTYDNGIVAKIAKSEDSESVIRDALKSKKTMLVLSTLAGKTKGGRESLSRSIADYVMKQKDPYDFLVQNEGTLRPVMDTIQRDRLPAGMTHSRQSTHFDNLKNIAEMRRILDRVNVPEHANIGDLISDALKGKTGTSFPEAVSHAKSISRMGISKAYIGSIVGMKFLFKKRNELNQIKMREAIYSKEIAEKLVKIGKATTEKQAESLYSDLRKHYYTLGIKLNTGTGVKGQDEKNTDN